MNDSRVSLNDYRFNIMSMMNLLQEAENSFPEGISRDAAYNEVGSDLGLADGCFSNIR